MSVSVRKINKPSPRLPSPQPQFERTPAATAAAAASPLHPCIDIQDTYIGYMLRALHQGRGQGRGMLFGIWRRTITRPPWYVQRHVPVCTYSSSLLFAALGTDTCIIQIRSHVEYLQRRSISGGSGIKEEQIFAGLLRLVRFEGLASGPTIEKDQYSYSYRYRQLQETYLSISTGSIAISNLESQKSQLRAACA